MAWVRCHNVEHHLVPVLWRQKRQVSCQHMMLNAVLSLSPPQGSTTQQGRDLIVVTAFSRGEEEG